MTRRRRKSWIVALGLVNAVALLIGSTAGLGLPDVAVRWVLLGGGVALLVRETLQRHEDEQRRKEPPHAPPVVVVKQEQSEEG